jgi:YfiH family protein
MVTAASPCPWLILGNMHPDWIIPRWPAPANVRAVCTTRAGGVSGGAYAHLNLGSHVGDDPAHVASNRSALERAIACRPVFMDQVHGVRMLTLDASTPNGASADSAFAQQTGVACTVMVADCLPILLCASIGNRAVAVAALHAGWRGLAGNEGHGVIDEFYKHFRAVSPVEYAQAAPKIIAWLGPCIGPQQFEVGDEVRAAFVQGAGQSAACFQPHSPGKWRADLPALARQRLLAAGVEAVYGNDGSSPWCTVTNPLRFFSYRRDRISGRQAACIYLV